MMRRFLGWLTLRATEPGIAMAQYREIRRQIPLLYSLLGVNALAVAYTHHGAAPAWMTVWIPAGLVAVCLLRVAGWLLAPARAVTAAEAIRGLRRTVFFGSLIALAYIAWSLKLGEYGNEHQQTHVAIFIAITVMGCIFCLMHLPQAALAVTAIVTLPYLAFYVGSGDAIYAAVGFNILLVTLVLLRVLFNSFDAFTMLIRTRVETERLNGEITKLAHTDILTGLPNRRLFFQEADRSVERCRTAGGEVALGVIDLDRFKAVNDTFGHVLGDELLEAAGTRLRAVFADHGLVARLGGDEFAFLSEGPAERAVALAGDACRALSEPYSLGALTVTIGASCGVAASCDIGGSARALYDGADYALYKAKSERRGFATLYSPDHERRIRSERAVEAALQTADLGAEMTVHLQPIAAVGDGSLAAVEALARWTSPHLGPVGPDVFIPLAERVGIMHRLTLDLLAKALACLDHLPAEIDLSFNLSAHDITCHETVMAIMALVRRSGVRPGRLILELTETAVVRDFETAEASMRLLRSLGIRIALDDFGTGQSSLSYLRRLPFDKVKIDRSFMAGAGDGEGRELLAAMVAFCRSMRKICIAEGVEDEEQLNFLAAIGCDRFQGYLLARPMPLDELVAFERARRPFERRAAQGR
ncbi:putative bifunctional diguanylate cyclase/phosphodiesterase [Jiella sonneratiae]|uniref:EAL domain-containing protein n=1 Tax=Jiella sonneratiae TaxID=2816856 RepID=A0ABS3IZW3_9HYPH|nr:EAL domain-containing protein [Jiella sonneratiae]MBO0902958.1 EAL domain-containing protein [Jiella sonneratiae]